jgi:hypothetical protein
MTDIPFIPEFSKADARNKWIMENAQYWTVIRKRKRRYERDECWSLEDAVKLAQRRLANDPHKQPLLIYAVAGGHDALAATVHPDGVRAVE